jgi:hypothetical protein
LAWLASQQGPDGSWLFDSGEGEDRVAATGLALLPFLAAGCTHIRAEYEPYRGKYRDTVLNGLRFLMRMCRRSGRFDSTSVTGQAIATLALCEAYGMTTDPLLEPYARSALNFLQRSQDTSGGWSDGPGGASDISVTGWAVQALLAGRAAGLDAHPLVIRNTMRFFDSVAAAARKAAPDPDPVPAAIGLLGHSLIGDWEKKHPELIAGVAGLVKNTQPATRDPLYLYYTSWVMNRYGGDHWSDWNEGLRGADGNRNGGVRDGLVGTHLRRGAGANTGSWEASGEFGRRYGCLGTTALNVLTLTVYDRHAPAKKKADGPVSDPDK